MCDEKAMQQQLHDFRIGITAAVNEVLATGQATIRGATGFYGGAIVIARHVILGETHEEALAAERENIMGEAVQQLLDETFRRHQNPS